MRVGNLMNRNVYACSRLDTLQRAAKLMWENDCGFLPVVEGRRVVGTVTDRDALMGAYTRNAPLGTILVSNVMSDDLVVCSVDDDVRSAESLMQRRRVRRLPVLDARGDLVGVITLGDLARHAQSTAFRRARESLTVAKTLAAVCEPRSTSHAAE